MQYLEYWKYAYNLEKIWDNENIFLITLGLYLKPSRWTGSISRHSVYLPTSIFLQFSLYTHECTCAQNSKFWKGISPDTTESRLCENGMIAVWRAVGCENL